MSLKIFLLISLVFITACAGPRLRPNNPNILPETSDLPPSLEESHYQLQLGDELEVKFYYQQDLNESQVIRPDGKISLQLINDVMAAGKTTDELARVITNRYRNILRHPEASVIIKKIVKAKVFIGGKVDHPGILEVDSTLTLMQAIIQAGSFQDAAEMREVLLIRRQNNYKKPKVYILNLENPENDLLLRPYDVVYVPPSTITQVDTFVQNYITRIIPFSFGVSYFINP